MPTDFAQIDTVRSAALNRGTVVVAKPSRISRPPQPLILPRNLVQMRSEAAQSLAAIDVRLANEFKHGMNTGRLAFSPDGKLLAAAEFKAQMWVIRRIKLIDVNTGTVSAR